MRLIPIIGGATLVLSATALAQVASAPVERKTPTGDERASDADVPADDGDAEAPTNDTSPPANSAADDPATLDNGVAGDPVDASTKPPGG